MTRRNPVRIAAKALSRFVREHANLCMVLVVLVLTLPLQIFSEKIDVGEGLGFDGGAYGRMAKDGLGLVRWVDSYRIQRVLPSLIVRLILNLLSLAPTNPNIIAGFIALNILCLAAIAFMWGRIADELEIPCRGKWLGFAGLFLNFAVLKMASYYPVLTDILAFAVSIAMLHFYLRRARLGLFTSTVLGAFVNPICIYMGVVLLIFPRKPATESKSALFDLMVERDTAASPTKPILRFFRSLRLLIPKVLAGRLPTITGQNEEDAVVRLSTVFASGVAYTLGLAYLFLMRRGYDPQVIQKTVPTAVRALGACVGITYAFLCVKYLLRARTKAWLLRFWTNVGSPVDVSIALTTLAVLRLLVFSSFPKSGNDNAISVAVSDVGLSYHLPGIFLVAHIVWFGPIIVLALFRWKSVLRHMGEYGFGLLLVCALGLAMSLNSESRVGITFLPMVVAFTVLAADRAKWNSRSLAIFVIISLLWSKAWLTIGPIKETAPGTLNLYFMNSGPWMTHAEYVFQLGLVLLLIVVLWITVPRAAVLNRTGIHASRIEPRSEPQD